MNEIFRRRELFPASPYQATVPEPSSQQLLFAGASLEILREMKAKLDNLDYRLTLIEKKIDERIPEKMLTESTFKEEVQGSDDIIEKIISEIKNVASKPIIATKEHLTVVESKKMEQIIPMLKEHGKLSSSQLAQMMNMSRTRCNEYFRQMEELGLAEGFLIGKEKFYRLKN